MDDYESAKVLRLRSLRYSNVDAPSVNAYVCSCGCGLHASTTKRLGGTMVEGCRALGFWKKAGGK